MPRAPRWCWQFFDWAFKDGASSAEALDYVPIPENVYQLVEKQVGDHHRERLARLAAVTHGG